MVYIVLYFKRNTIETVLRERRLFFYIKGGVMECPVCYSKEFYKAPRCKREGMMTPFYWICKGCGVHFEDRRASGWEENQQVSSQNTGKR